MTQKRMQTRMHARVCMQGGAFRRCAHPRVGDRHSESGRLTVHGAFALLVVGVLLVMIVGGAQALGVFQTWRVQLQTQADLAKAERAAQEANRLAALEALERARGDRELHEAAAASIRKDSLVVAWYAVRGDVLALALGVPFMVVLGATLGTMIGRRLAKIRNDPDAADAGGAA